jgi:GTPase
MIVLNFVPDKKLAMVHTGTDSGYTVNEVDTFKAYENEDGTIAFQIIGEVDHQKSTIKGRADVYLLRGVTRE